MTENDKMEDLSIQYVQVLASMGGYFNQTGRDFGTDLTFRKANLSAGRSRYLTGGKSIDFQLKSVHKRYTNIIGKYLVYNMEVKNYNDLVERKQANGDYTPLYLIVFVVPNRTDDWIEHSVNELKIRECAYWYEIDSNAAQSKNTSKIAIHIPLDNVVDSQLFDTLFSRLN